VKTKTRKIKEAIKTNKGVTRISQHDIDGAGGKARFVHTTPEDDKKIIEGKLRDLINKQEELRETNLASMYSYAELEELERIHDNYDNKVTDGTWVEKPEWYGIAMPKKLLTIEMKMKELRFVKIMRKLEYLKNQLKSAGFSDEQLVDVMSGKYIKDFKKLKKIQAKS